jgi:hypothetical protein
MNDDAHQHFPKTIGKLRRRLAELGHPWEVDPQLSDDDPLPDPPRGGQPEEEIPPEHRIVPLEVDADLQSLIAQQPPANPFLRRRWAEAGLLSQEEVEGMPPESDEGQGGAV